MKKVIIFDPALCCPTGLCGVNIDPELMRIAVVVETLKRKGIIIERYNLRDHPQKYIDHKNINQFLMNEGAEKLPVVTVDGEIAVTGAYPTNQQIAEWIGVEEVELRIKR
jgi:glutaredoxin